ncbi:MAG: magnesium transporter CorA family protein [Acetobacteraceae bacterium]
MLNAYTIHDGPPRRLDPNTPDTALAQAVWLDLLEPTPEELARVRTVADVALPDRDTIHEIESSSRLSARNGAIYLNIPMIGLANGPRGVAVGFVLTPSWLITIRFTQSRSFDTFAANWADTMAPSHGPAHVFVGLMEVIIDRQADTLEAVRSDLDRISGRIFGLAGQGQGARREEDRQLRETLSELGRTSDLISLVRDTQVVVARVVPFVETATAEWLPRDTRARLRTLAHDVTSIADFANHLNDKLQFMLDATLGFINIAQNNLMKVMTIASVAGIPPVLVAGIYGMNFHRMPELDWTWGYAWALALIILSTVIPLAAFRWRGWL